MKQNANLVLSSARCHLVPYRREHVLRYHHWMEDAELRAATASERLTLQACGDRVPMWTELGAEEEYDMQRKWADDADKCTFIVLDAATPDTEGTGSHGGGMAGDVNLFFNDMDGNTSVAEIEVMIAEKGSRRHGLAETALQMLMAYAAQDLGVTKFCAKIGEDNSASLALFQQQLGFVEVSRSKVFQEVTLEKEMKRTDAEALWARNCGWRRSHYDD